MTVYLDNSATTAQSSEVTAEMVRVAENIYGNPSSLHRLGIEAEKELKSARRKTAHILGVSDEEIYFTSGGTESDNMAIFKGTELLKREGNKMITTRIEHPAVLECCKRLEHEGMEVIYLNVDEKGFVDPSEVKRVIDDKTVMVSIMHVNNETGAIQPIYEIGEIIKRASKALSKRILFHCDAVQSFGKLNIDLKSANIDFLSASAHKLHGPRGIGLFYMKKGIHIKPFIYGGGQESGIRSGTENLPAICGFAKAVSKAESCMEENFDHVKKLRDHLLNKIISEISDIRINSPFEDTEKGLPYVLNISFRNTRSEVLLHMLEQHDIYVSTGSACSSKKRGGSHVLDAMGLKPAEIEGTIRFSFSAYNTIEEIDYTIEHLKNAVAENRKILSLAAGGRRR